MRATILADSKLTRKSKWTMRRNLRFGKGLADLEANVVDEQRKLATVAREFADFLSSRAQFDGSSSAIAERLNDAAGHAVDYADEFVHEKPWHTLGAVAGLALLVGFLAGRA